MQTEETVFQYDEIIHYDARIGYEVSLKAYLKHRPECLNRLYKFQKFNWTLLIAACYYGHEEIVQMLVNQFQADVEAEGTVLVHTRDNYDEKVEGVTALWVAAAMNHFNIVKFLVQFGRANVNHLTKQHDTPFRAACYHENLQMLQFLVQYGANPHQTRLDNHTNLSLAVHKGFAGLIKYLVDDVKCDLNQADAEGRTPLHDTVENNLLVVTTFLLNRGALNLRDKSRNISPLMLAAVLGKQQLVTAFHGHCSEIEWIEALELLGSAFAGCLPDEEDMDTAVEYLIQAFQARTAHNLPKLRSQRTSELFNYRQECETLDELHQLVSFGSNEHFYLEALLIQERILGTSSQFYHQSLLDIGHSLRDMEQYDLCFRLWFYELDLRQERKIPFNHEHLRSFVNLCQHLFLNDKIVLFIQEFFKVFRLMIRVLSASEYINAFDFNLITLLHLLTIASELLLKEHSNGGEKLSLAHVRALTQYIRAIVRKGYVTKQFGSSLLHLCCNEQTVSIQDGSTYVLRFDFFLLISLCLPYRYPCFSTVRVLLECGVDVNAMDAKRRTAIHILIGNNELNDSLMIIDFLCDIADAHIDFADDNGNSPIDLPYIPVFHTLIKIQHLRAKTGVLSLKCCCARLVKYKRSDYAKHLPSSLITFVDKH